MGGVYKGSPSIRLEGDEAKALALVPRGKELLAIAQGIAERAGVPTYSMQEAVDDATIYVLVAGAINVIQINANSTVPGTINPPEESEETPLLPSFLSGVVTDGRIITKTTTDKDGNTVTYDVLDMWIPTSTTKKRNNLGDGILESKRLAVKPDAAMDLEAPEGVSAVYSQYFTPRASMWSGTMKKVVQLLMGYGKMDYKMLLDPKNPVVTSYDSEVKSNGVRIKYDFRYTRTHGITIGDDGTLWLVEINSARGVLAMQLPLFPNSTTSAFRSKAVAAKDTELVAALDTLGCLPTGESFPTGTNLTKAIAAGTVLQLATVADLSDFYKMSAYSSVCGWAFNADGTQAHNVGYYLPDTDVFFRGGWYQLTIHIGALKKKREKNTPIADGSAKLTQRGDGYLWSGTAKKSYLPFKYYEPLIGGLLSATARPAGGGTVPDCDTVIFVAFMDGDLKVGKFFHKEATTAASVTNTADGVDCLWDGSWTYETKGAGSMATMCYTNDFDDRRVLVGGYSSNVVSYDSLGFNPPTYSDFIESPETCLVTRSKAYKITAVAESYSSETQGGVLVVPQFAREAYYYYTGSNIVGHAGGTTVSYASLLDPNQYYGWRKFPRINPPPWPSGYGCGTENCGGKHPGRKIMCYVPVYDTCSDHADSGSWASNCQDIEALCSNKAPTRTGHSSSWNKGDDFTGAWYFISDSSGAWRTGTLSEGDWARATTQSPDSETDLVQSVLGEFSALGEACIIYQKGFGGDTVVEGTIPQDMDNRVSFPTFIGVNGK